MVQGVWDIVLCSLRARNGGCCGGDMRSTGEVIETELLCPGLSP
jgi:hypothetical protein